MELDLNESYVNRIKELNLKAIDMDEIRERDLEVFEVEGIGVFDLKENHEDGIEERMKRIEAVVFRAKQHQSRQQDQTPIQNINIEGKNIYTRKSSCLVAKALDENFYDCNICFIKANNPVVTCCGHLFCWPCFYLLPYAHYNAKECPVCEGVVVEEDLIPIYGNPIVNDTALFKLKENFVIPARPNANRIERIDHV